MKTPTSATREKRILQPLQAAHADRVRRDGRRHLWLVPLWLLLTGAVPLSAAQRVPRSCILEEETAQRLLIDQLKPYRQVVEIYRDTGLSAAMRSLADWTDADFDGSIAVLEKFAQRLVLCAEVGDGGWNARTLAAAALLHAELAFADPRHGAGVFHIERAGLLFRLVPDTLDVPFFRSRWLMSIGCLHRQRRTLNLANKLLRQALEELTKAAPDVRANPIARRLQVDLLLALGSISEVQADRPFASCVSIDECHGDIGKKAYVYENRERGVLRRQALKHYRQAVALEPLPEARLRLGRALLLDGRHEQAEAQLRLAADRTTETYVFYLARLFLGGLRGEQQRWQEAVQAYREAHETNRQGQTARLALAHALRRVGDIEGQNKTLASLMRGPARLSDVGRQNDPIDYWWSYFTGPLACEPPRREALRREVLD